MSFKTKGMNQDLSVSAFNPEFSFENHNLRLSTNEGNTLMSWVNEKGPALLEFEEGNKENSIAEIKGIVLGTAVISNKLVLFTHEETDTNIPDHIYLIEFSDTSRTKVKGEELFNGNLEFSLDNPLETLVSYENDLVQKVYWTDGKNQPRVININEDYEKYYTNVTTKASINTIFDFVREIKLNEKVKVTKLNNGSGTFPAGVIQYAFTYFTKYGQESNIFYTTPLYYTSHNDRAGSPEDAVANAFKINITDLDDTFDYVRIYSIMRTSLDGTPIVKRIQDVKIDDSTITREDEVTPLVPFAGKDSFFISTDGIGGYIRSEEFKDIDEIREKLPEIGEDIWDPAPQAFTFDKEWNKRENSLNVDFSSDPGVVIEYEYDDANKKATVLNIYNDREEYKNAFIAVIPEEITVYKSFELPENSVTPAAIVEEDEINGSITIIPTLPKYENKGTIYTVTKIAAGAFKDNKTIDKLTIPNTIEEIGDKAFYNFSGDIYCKITADNIRTKEGLQNNLLDNNNPDEGRIFNKPETVQGSGMNLIIPDGDGVLEAYINAGWTGDAIKSQNTESEVTGIDGFFDLITTASFYRDYDPRFYDGAEYYYVFKKKDYQKLVLKYGEPAFTWKDGASDEATIFYFPQYTRFEGYNNVDPLLNGVLLCEDLINGEWKPLPLKRIMYSRQTPTIQYIDTNTEGTIEDVTKLLYLGGESIKAKTINAKDGTLFLGNIEIQRPSVADIQDKVLEKNEVTVASPLIKSTNNILCTMKRRPYSLVNKGEMGYINTLSCPEEVYDNDNNLVPYQGASCFKSNEYYRLGLQFQYKTGKWSDPIWIGDKQWVSNDGMDPSSGSIGPRADAYGNNPNFQTKNIGVLAVPEFIYTLSSDITNELISKEYKRVRAVYAQPRLEDRTILYQGVLNSTMFRLVDRHSDYNNRNVGDGTIYAQSSWLFRTKIVPSNTTGYRDDYGYAGMVEYRDTLPTFFANIYEAHSMGDWDGKMSYQWWDEPGVSSNPEFLGKVWMSDYRSTEIMGQFDWKDTYRIDSSFVTFHSPDVELDDTNVNLSLINTKLYTVGYTQLSQTFGDIDIQTSTPTIGSSGIGFNHRMVKTHGYSALISGNFYEDNLVWATSLRDDKTPVFERLRNEKDVDKGPVLWPVFMWHRKGSLNNDVNRDNQSAKLLKKIISNYRNSTSTHYEKETKRSFVDMQVFNNNEASQIIKVNGKVYQGCVDTMVIPSTESSFYFVGEPFSNQVWNWKPKFEDVPVTKTFVPNTTDFITADTNDWTYFAWKAIKNPNGSWSVYRDVPIGTADAVRWVSMGDNWDDLGKRVPGVTFFKDAVPIKYKSTPHIAIQLLDSPIDTSTLQSWLANKDVGTLCVAEIRIDYNPNTLYGGTSNDALQAATWIPCGPVVQLVQNENATIEFKWGDTYFQKHECLKTYPYTTEDINQVIEIGSFYLESRVNVAGRYDRNRGLISNLHVSPQNFNLINPVYSQQDNIFNYRILPEDYYKINKFSNQITWTKTKTSGEVTDMWTNITLASTLDLDGANGELNKLTKVNNNLYAFQDKAIAQILYNESTQISTTDGVPVEIANTGKVGGNRYINTEVGCSNKESILETVNGIYFIDQNSKSIYLLNDQLTNLSNSKGMNSWCSQNIPSYKIDWSPKNFENFISRYDKQNQEVLFINKDTTLAFSEKLGAFTSFYDYGDTPYLCNIEGTGIWVTKEGKLWKHQAGEYCNFFGKEKPYGMILVGNPEPQADKMFTNLEFRAYADEDDVTPFDSLTTWNEYQEGSYTFTNNMKNASFLSKKFRMWRCNIPRDRKHIMDRMRGPWLYLKLEKNTDTSSRVEIHDIAMTYYK